MSSRKEYTNLQRVIIIRHGQTNENVKKIIQGGDLDTNLNKVGKEQAKKCGDFLNKYFKFDTVICSPMIRTKQTAKIVCKQLNFDHNKITYDENLREKRHGKIISGKKDKDLRFIPKIGPKIKYIDDIIGKLNIIERKDKKWEKYEDKIMKLTNGETFAQFRQRIKRFIRKINHHIKNNNGNLLVVTHGGVIRDLLKIIIGHDEIPEDYGAVHNCSITIINYKKNKPNVIMAQYTKYLDKK
jgi:broad specificity phosphatase PhoE